MRFIIPGKGDFGVGFEARVATGLAAFIKTYDASVSRPFTASIEDGLVGSLAIAGSRPLNAPASWTRPSRAFAISSK
jgi:hypothetical protein